MRLTRLIFAAFLMGVPVWADPQDADKAEEKARSSFIDQFSKFMQDKNVQGRAKRPDGKVVGGGKKTRFNQDDGLAFQSDLTYHDFSYNTLEQGEEKVDSSQKQGAQKAEKPPEKRLFAHVSGHGGISAAGGSSVLERAAYALDKKFAEQDEKKKPPEEEGVKYRSIFKVTTKEIFEGKDAPKADQDKAKEGEKDKVDRFELREEARPEIDKVGADSAQTIIQSARGEENANDDKALGNGVLLRQAAYEATKALWNSTLANLAQRRMNRAIRSGAMPVAPQISEGVPRCEEWSSVAQDVINKADPKRREELLKDVKRMMDQCKEVASVRFNEISPNFAQQEKGGEKLEFEGPQKEDAFQRDARLQLEIMNKAGKSVTEIPANWQFSKDDDKARMTISYDDNQPKEGSLTIKEQLESYNANLKDAEEGYQEVSKRIPGLEVPKPTDYAIQPGTRNVMEINQPPESAFEEVGIKKSIGTGPVPQTYEELLKNAQTN